MVTEELDCSFQDFEQQDKIGSGGNADVYKSSVKVNGDEQIIALKSPRMTEYDTVDTSFFDEFIEKPKYGPRLMATRILYLCLTGGVTHIPGLRSNT